MKVRKVALIILAGLAISFFVLEAYGAHLIKTAIAYASRPNQENRTQKIDRILADVAQADRMTFAVIGNTRSGGALATLCRKVIAQDIAFIVILGDQQNRATEIEQYFLQMKMDEIVPKTIPIIHLLVRPSGEINGHIPKDRVFSFAYRGKNVVFAPLNPEILKEWLQNIELNQIAHFLGAKRALAFMPSPLPERSHFQTVRTQTQIERILEKHNADAVYLGAMDQAVLINLSPDGRSEQVLTLAGADRLYDLFQFAVGPHFYPILRNQPAVGISANLVAMIMLVFALRRLRGASTKAKKPS